MEGILSQLTVALPEGQHPEAAVDTPMTQLGQSKAMRLFSVLVEIRVGENTQRVKRVITFPGGP